MDRESIEKKLDNSKKDLDAAKQIVESISEIIDHSCFMTTAVCGFLKKGDDCYELNQFRKFRDEWLANQSDGQMLIEEYEKIAPELVTNIENHPERNHIYVTLWERYLSVCLKEIENMNYEECKKIFTKMIKKLVNGCY